MRHPTAIASNVSLVRHDLRDAGAGIGVGIDRRGFSGEGVASVATVAREATTGRSGGGGEKKIYNNQPKLEPSHIFRGQMDRVLTRSGSPLFA